MAQQSRISGAMWLVLAQAVVLILGYTTHLWIGRWLGRGPYGVYGVVLSIQTIVGLILTLGVPVAVSRFVAQNQEHAQAILRQALRIQAAMAAIVVSLSLLTSPLISNLLGDPSLTPLISFVAIVLLFQAFYPVFTQFLSGLHQFNRQAYLTIGYAIVKLLGAISLLSAFQVYGAFAGFGIGGLVAAIIGWFWTRGIGTVTAHRLPLRPFLSFSGFYVLILVTLQLLISLDLFMVKALLGDDVLAGEYNAAVTLARIPYFLLQGLAFILLPSVSALTKPGESHDQAAAFIRDALRYLIALIVPSVALAAATSRSLIELFFSAEYLMAAPALTILMVGVGSIAFYLLLANIVAGAGRPAIVLWITLGLVGLSAVLGIILIPRFELLGAAIQTTAAGLVGLTILAHYTFHTFRIPVPWRSIINILIATAAATSLTYLGHFPPLWLPILYLLCYLVYVIVLFVTGEITNQDRQRLAAIHPLLRRLVRV